MGKAVVGSVFPWLAECPAQVNMDWGQYDVVHGQLRNDFNSYACLSKLPKRSIGFPVSPVSNRAG